MARYGFRSLRLSTTLGALALVALPLGVARPATAGDPPPSEARAAATTAAIETANLRAKAKLELARILDREGRTEEAMAALLEADRILVDAARLAAELAAPSPQRRTPAPSTVPFPRPPSSGGKPLLLGPFVPGPESHPSPSRLMPRRDPVPSGVRYLLGRQGVDGSFDVTDGVNDGSDRAKGRKIAVTAWALLALAEVATGDGLGDGAKSLAEPAVVETGRAAGFLLSTAKDDGSLAPSIEDHCLAGWAVASALSRLGPRLLEAIPGSLGLSRGMVERRLVAAMRKALSAQDPATGRLAGGGTPDEQALAAIAFVGFLHELEPMPLSEAFVESDPLDRVRARVMAAFSGPLTPAALPKTRAGREALALLRRDRAGLEPEGGPPAARDALHLLYGTVSASSLGSEEDREAWWRDVLVPAMNAQAADGVDGVGGGSFPSGPDGLGSTHATALSLLAWLYPDMEWRAPAGN